MNRGLPCPVPFSCSCTFTIYPYALAGPLMEDYGQGYCKHGYLRGWDRKGIESQAACNAVCLAEADCTYAAWNSGKTCSRYKGASCQLNGVGDHYTYKKVHGLAGSVTSPPPTLHLPVLSRVNLPHSDLFSAPHISVSRGPTWTQRLRHTCIRTAISISYRTPSMM